MKILNKIKKFFKKKEDRKQTAFDKIISFTKLFPGNRCEVLVDRELFEELRKEMSSSRAFGGDKQVPSEDEITIYTSKEIKVINSHEGRIRITCIEQRPRFI